MERDMRGGYLILKSKTEYSVEPLLLKQSSNYYYYYYYYYYY